MARPIAFYAKAGIAPIRDLNQGLPSTGPQGLKPVSSLALGGTTEVVPFPKPFVRPV
ncbi:hypothetical protein SBA7_20012 [Candidatus Sulfotelmatobacter sp. SbA7]|nr:hypothetical protein SBA7_20012 [Candidatus Sulfotelmatobacter sp. SbA7]